METEQNMEIVKEQTGNMLSIALSGRLDALAAPKLDAVIKNELDGIAYLVFDLKDLTYAASAGLRVILTAHKRMSRQGSMKLTHVNKEILDVLDLTGLLDYLSIED